MAEAQPETSPSPFATGLAGRCPRCGKGRLFDGFLALRPRCEACGLDFSFADSGDGPAVFVMFIAGFIVVGCALLVEVKYAADHDEPGNEHNRKSTRLNSSH